MDWNTYKYFFLDSNVHQIYNLFSGYLNFWTVSKYVIWHLVSELKLVLNSRQSLHIWRCGDNSVACFRYASQKQSWIHIMVGHDTFIWVAISKQLSGELNLNWNWLWSAITMNIVAQSLYINSSGTRWTLHLI